MKSIDLDYVADTYGIIYNRDLFDSEGWTVPNTTTELFALCDQMQEKAVPFIAAGDERDKAWSDLFYVWWGQYEGIDNYKNFWDGVNANGVYSRDIFAQEGRLHALTAMETLVKENYLSTQSYSFATTANDAAMSFLFGESSSTRKTIAMLPYGESFDKVCGEIKEYYPEMQYPELGIMKVPVISSIIQQCSTIENDQMLSSVIEAIDRGEQSYANVSATDFAIIKNARTITAHATTMAFSITKNVKNMIAAKQFLAFVASEEGFSVALENGVKPALNYSVSATQKQYLSKLQNEAMDICKNAVYLPLETHTILYRIGIFRELSGVPFGVGACIGMMRNRNKTAQTIYDDTLTYYTQQKFEEDLNRII